MHNPPEVDLGEYFQTRREHDFRTMRTFSPMTSPPLSPLTMSVVSHRLSPIGSPNSFQLPLPLLSRSIIFSLPIEIWLSIFDYFHNEQLFVLASISQFFQGLCLEKLCRRMHFSRGSDVIFGDPRDNGSSLLLRSLIRLKWEIPKLTFTFRHSISDCRFPGEIAVIRRILEHIQRHSNHYPSEIALEFCNMGASLLFAGPGSKRAEKRSIKPLEDLFSYIISLTGTLSLHCGRAKRAIRKSHVTNAVKQLGLVEEAEPPAPSLDIVGQVRSSFSHCFPQFFGFASTYCGSDTIDMQELQELPFYSTNDFRRRTETLRLGLPSTGLRKLIIHSPILFHPSILRWTMNLFSSQCMGLTHLSLHTPEVPRSCWQILLPHLRAPQLHSLSLDDCSFSLADISTFVTQQTQLRSLVLGHHFADSTVGGGEEHRPPWIPPDDITSISATPNHFTRLLFGPKLVAPNLEFATFLLRTGKDESIADMDKTLSFIYDRLRTVNMTLQLTVTPSSARWFHSQTQRAPTLGSQRTPIRHLMSSLRICADIYRLENDFWKLLPGWIAAFLPNILSVSIVERHRSSHHECGLGTMIPEDNTPERLRLVKDMKRQCQSVVFLRIGDVKYPLDA